MSKFNVKSAAAAAGVVLLLGSSAAMADTIYSSIPAPLPDNVPSLGYQATATSQFGDQVHFAGTARELISATVTLSDWAKYSTYSGNETYSPTGFSVPMTLNLYQVGSGNSVGALIASVTAIQNIQWRPEADPSCGNGGWGAGCSNGLAQNVTFDFTSGGIGTLVPDDVVYGLVFNTQSYGPNPIGTDGPYNSLNFGLNTDPTAPYIGSTDPDSLFWDTSYHPFYTAYDSDATAFQKDTAWSPYIPAAQFDAVVPEPLTISLFAAGLVGAGALRRRKKVQA